MNGRSRSPIDGGDAQQWRGVVLALDETACGRAAYRIKLWCVGEPSLVPVMETFDGREAIGEWTARALELGLTKFIETSPGRIEGAELQFAQAMAGQIPACRRRGAELANRRSATPSRRAAMAARRRA